VDVLAAMFGETSSPAVRLLGERGMNGFAAVNATPD